ncbi:MAG: tetratricopeptide repeat protein [Nitrospiraceae bacterium]|nr:tetratricopeptide repeat protein [Nitrospiraceae bacterium]
MNRKQLLFLLLITSIYFSLYACGGQQIQTLPVVHTKAIEYNQKGLKAAEKGDYEKALNYNLEALKLNRSIENTDGTAVNMLNIAVLYSKKGDTAEAHKYINDIFALQGINDATMSEALFENARLYLKEIKLAEAREYAKKSLSLHKGTREGSRWNILSRIALIESKYDEAFLYAGTALKLNISNNQAKEESNSLRLLADLNMIKKNYSESRKLYENALEIDKKIGDSKKIALTLRSLGELCFRQGELKDSKSYFIRAYEVSRNAGDMEGTIIAIDALTSVYEKSGDKVNAEKLLKEKTILQQKIK